MTSTLPTVETDVDASAHFLRSVGDALHGAVLDDDLSFCCAHGPKCRASVTGAGFAAGQLSYVGDHYAASIAGRPFRILVVAMQVGDDEAPVTLERRRDQIRSRIPERFGDRNQHMAGVTTALRVLFGGEPGPDADGEWIQTSTGLVHVLDAYAMANSTLCSKRPGGGREGSPTAEMVRNCSRNLAATIEALRPSIIQSQGMGKTATTYQAVERLVDREYERWDQHVARVSIAGVDAVWCALRHPARNWGQLGRSYLHGVAVPALSLARRCALE